MQNGNVFCLRVAKAGGVRSLSGYFSRKIQQFRSVYQSKKKAPWIFFPKKRKKNVQTKTPTITTVVMGKIQMSRFSSNQAMVSSQYYHCYFVFSLHVFQNIIVPHFRNGIFSEMMFTLSL